MSYNYQTCQGKCRGKRLLQAYFCLYKAENPWLQWAKPCEITRTFRLSVRSANVATVSAIEGLQGQRNGTAEFGELAVRFEHSKAMFESSIPVAPEARRVCQNRCCLRHGKEFLQETMLHCQVRLDAQSENGWKHCHHVGHLRLAQAQPLDPFDCWLQIFLNAQAKHRGRCRHHLGNLRLAQAQPLDPFDRWLQIQCCSQAPREMSRSLWQLAPGSGPTP